MDKVFIRELREEDAKTSWNWRNNKSVWQHTGSKPDRVISYEIELEWLQNVLKRDNEIRFAICETETGKYIGNVQLTNINSYDATFHIFLGETDCWGKGYGTDATRLMVKYGLDVLKLQSIWLDVNKENIAAIRTYEKVGFLHLFDYDEYHRMTIHKLDSISRKVSVFVMTYNHEEFISEALDGMVNQRVNFDFEIVVGDDFSTDNTRTVILKYAINYPLKFKLLFYPKNLSAAINQNWVLKNCKGKYTALCEGDDYWTDPLKLQKQVDFLEANPQLAGCFSDAIAIDTVGNKLRDALLPEHKKQVGIKNIGNFWMPTLSVCFKREYLTHVLNAKRVHEVYNGDMLLYYTISQHGDFGYVQTEPSCYREHAGGIWSTVKIIERYRRNLISDFIIYDILLPQNKQYMLSRIETNLQWQLNHYRSHEHISEIPKFLKQNIKQLLQRKRYREAASLLSCTLPVLASRTRQKLTRQ